MLHQKPDTFVAEPPPRLTALERRKARQWIAGARRAGLSVFPWHGSCIQTSNGWVPDTNCRAVATFGQDIDGPNNFSAATDRFHRSRACHAVDGLRKGVVFDVLCEEFGVDPADPGMCEKVNAQMRTADEERRARA